MWVETGETELANCADDFSNPFCTNLYLGRQNNRSMINNYCIRVYEAITKMDQTVLKAKTCQIFCEYPTSLQCFPALSL